MNSRIKWLWAIFLVTLALTLVAEYFVDYHGHFRIDGLPLFHAWFGFLACAGIVVFSKLVGVLLKRPTEYYEEKHHGK